MALQAIIVNLSNIDLRNTNWGIEANKINSNFAELLNAFDSVNPVQSDWNETDPNSLAYILNKPDLEQSIFVIVETLPPVEEADQNKFYLVPSDQTSETDLFDEYIVVNHDGVLKWEYLGTKNMGEIDLSNYWNKTELPPAQVEKLKSLTQVQNMAVTLLPENWTGDAAPFRYTIQGNFPDPSFSEIYPVETSEDYFNEVGIYTRVVGYPAEGETPAYLILKAREKPVQNIDIEVVTLT